MSKDAIVFARLMSVTAAVCVVLALTCGVSMGGVLWSVDHNDLPGVGDPVTVWGDFNKTFGAPVVADLGGVKWLENHSATGDRFTHNSGAHTAPIPINGATIVTAIKPERGANGNPWTSIVDIFYDQLCLGVRNDTGQITVKVSGNNAPNHLWFGPVLPEEPGVLSLTVGNGANPAFEVFWRGENDPATVSMGTGNGNTGGQPYTALYPGAGGRGYAKWMNVGRNEPDFWPTFNGLIGDTIVFDEQLSPEDLLVVQDQVREAMGIGAEEGEVPEPATMALFGLGVGALALRRRRRA